MICKQRWNVMTGGALALAGSVCFAGMDARAATAEPLRLAATHLPLATESNRDGTVTLAVTLTNTGSVAAENMRLVLLAGPGLPVMPGENVLAVGGLAAGQTVTLSWPIRVRTPVAATRGGLPLMVIHAEAVAADGTTPVSTGVLSRAGNDPRAKAGSGGSATEHLRRGSTERVSVDSAGNQGNDFSGFSTAISADGRFVAFPSEADNLVPGDTNGVSDIFVHDRKTGVTERVSVDSAGNQGNDGSFTPAITAHGRFVAFDSEANNLVPGDTNGVFDAFVHDRKTGVTERVSVDSAGTQGNSFSGFSTAISAHGRFVAFDSVADNLVPDDTNDIDDVFVHDRKTGVTERVSVDSAGTQGNSVSFEPAISADGRFVAFSSFADNLVPDDTNDRKTGVTERVSVDSVGNQGNSSSSSTAISAHGRFVAFDSVADNLVPGDTNGASDAFVHDRKTGATERVSSDSAGNQSNSSSFRPAITAHGRFVAFESFADNLVPGDTNGATDTFVHDRKREIAETDGAELRE